MLRNVLRRNATMAASGYPESTLYREIVEGKFPKPFRLSERSVGWPEDEVAAWQQAKIAGASDDEIKALVARLHAARSSMKEAA